jgi:hypothetical protein
MLGYKFNCSEIWATWLLVLPVKKPLKATEITEAIVKRDVAIELCCVKTSSVIRVIGFRAGYATV